MRDKLINFDKVPENLHGNSKNWVHVPLFYSNGSGWTQNSAHFPTIRDILAKMGGERHVPPTGVISLSRIESGTHILAHCGASNIRARSVFIQHNNLL